jgi:SAM-dependent methyltransferase
MEQAAFYAAETRALLVEAGIGPGMRVLDVGCGVGDVSLLAADLVGSAGAVVGVDRQASALATARSRAAAAGLGQVSFIQGDLAEVMVDGPLDAVIGRFVLMYLGDPVAVLRHLAAQVRPEGVVAFQEYDFTAAPLCLPLCPTVERCITWTIEALRRAGAEMQMGLRLHPTFVRAGLPAPRLHMEIRAGGGPDFPGYRLLAQFIRTVMPQLERLGLTTAAEVDIDTLAERLREEVVASGGVLALPAMVGAWARTVEDPAEPV